MIEHNLKVKDDIIEPVSLVIPSGNVETHVLILDFNDTWTDLKKMAVFTRDGTAKEYTIDGNTRTIPGDILSDSGEFTVGVYGYIMDGETLVKRLSTNILTGKIIKGAYSNAEQGESDVPPSAYEELESTVENHIADRDNPHEVTADQVGAYGKQAIDDAFLGVNRKIAAKLDKVKSDFILYPGIYATTDTDGTPYLIIATSNLGYIGKGSGYIATYDGGELKTGTPTSDDSAANKAYVDEKAKVSDVKVAGTSAVADGTANIPNVLALGDDGKLRVANAPDKTKWTGPLGVDNTGLLTTAGPNNIVINNRTASSIQLLNCAYLDYAVKAAMCDGKGAVWTDTEKAAARERMGIKDYKLLATLNFTENASTFTLATLNGQPIALKSMAVIMNRIGDGESANGYITPVFTVKGANGASTNKKGGYFYGIGADGNCWYTHADISGEFFDSESACMTPRTNSQLGNGWMATNISKNMDWRNFSDDFLPITQITGFKITANGNCITNGSTMWIYGREE